ncbi:Endonuclease, Uma2 family (restriction endonuclease fold) [Candidatus Electrothrix aarhusensis]|uniref:Endonuclease, Uma2 family (Restriction endonuclease fold) n=1 Tax=Candidatus Electrothrix aarhusensis TaxID=1859131 RepID=A0A3S3UBF3_9BACT|nr:Endonuclease, Uma2 family (restriction endonuclease fold) [Candidatus Electrothrix aarhusensis]
MALPQQSHVEYSYADYISWDDQERWELINGEAWAMSPAPSRLHQAVSARIFYALFDHFKDKNCEVYAAPFDVRLSDSPDTKEADDTEITTIVQPDISVICDRKKLDDRGCIGAPELVIEILSPSTAAKDLKVKRVLYEQHGVKEYWLLHPTDRIAMLYTLNQGGEYGKAQILDCNDVLTSEQFEQLRIELTSVFIDE